MRVGGLAMAAALCLALSLAPGATAADETSVAIGDICSAEHGAAPAGSTHQLVKVSGVGTGGFPIATTKPEAQAWFDYGVQLAHAFYHADAKLAFERAEAIDPACAMCAWGEAWAAGPTINFDVDGAAQAADKALAAKAAKLGKSESAKNRGLIGALTERYVARDAASDLAFAQAMDRLSRKYPTDSEVAIMASDAWLIVSSLHNDNQGLKRAVELLEPVLKRSPNETGAIHFYIHATEMAGEAARALPYAERLAGLAPGASHLVHMASHTYFLVGRYEDAAAANAAAIGADGAYLRAAHDATPQGKVAYHGHDLRFGLASALISGDAPLGLRLADHTAFAFPAGVQGSQMVRGSTYEVYGRYAPERALALPEPPKDLAVADALRHYARGEALATRGDVAGVKAEAALTVLAPDAVRALPADNREAMVAVVKIARLTLQGRVAMLEGKPKDAAPAYKAAAELQEAKLSEPYMGDPPQWWYPERRSLAAALLAAGQPVAAAKEADRALKTWPLDPLSLKMKSQAETALGQTADAARDLAQARQGWHGGDVPLARI